VVHADIITAVSYCIRGSLRVRESKDISALTQGDTFRNLDNVLVERATVYQSLMSRDSPHVVQVREDESLLGVEAACDNVCNVADTIFTVLLERNLLLGISLQKILFIVCRSVRAAVTEYSEIAYRSTESQGEHRRRLGGSYCNQYVPSPTGMTVLSRRLTL
jgi:hypothetical protein